MGARIHETCCVCAKGLLTESLESVRGWHGFAIELGEMFNLLKRLHVPVPVYDASPDALFDVDVVGALEALSDQQSQNLPA